MWRRSRSAGKSFGLRCKEEVEEGKREGLEKWAGLWVGGTPAAEEHGLLGFTDSEQRNP